MTSVRKLRKRNIKTMAGYWRTDRAKLTRQGIIPELGITEELRDRLSKKDWTKKPEISLKQRNPDNLTTGELAKTRFSGFRWNDIRGLLELWVTGDIMAEASARELRTKGPVVLATMHERVFATTGTFAEVGAMDALYQEVMERYIAGGKQHD